METQLDLQSFFVVWRGQKLVIEMNPHATLKDLGDKLQELTHVEADTLRLLVPMEKSSKLLYPFSDDHSHMSLKSSSVLKGNSIRMMGVPKDEVDELLQNAKADLRIAGFDEEERRLKQRRAGRSYTSLKLPQGDYIFCDFRTLSLPGVELDPPASKALQLLYKLASDPGIVAIMNKHHWRVGILTEMAPVGYVGISPKCILGFNKNHGVEISLRLRTDDLKGFRKYESIKKTLLHELAHMVFSEHDSDFYALDKQLNKEAAAFDWTKSTGHTLSGHAHSEQYDDEFEPSSNVTSSQTVGGRVSVLQTARAASVNAALARFASSSTPLSGSSEVPEPNILEGQDESKSDPDDSEGDEHMVLDSYEESEHHHFEPDQHELSLNDSGVNPTEPNLNGDFNRRITILESELDHPMDQIAEPLDQTAGPLDQMDSTPFTSIELPRNANSTGEPHPNESREAEIQKEPDYGGPKPRIESAEPDPYDPDLQVIQDPVTELCGRLQSATQSLINEAAPGSVIQTLIKIISNVIENPNELKFKKLRKANPLIQRNVVTYKAAVEILKLIGFHEDVVVDESGNAEPFFLLKRNDPGLLWLAKSTLETCIL